MDVPPQGGSGQQPVPMPPLQVVVVFSTVVVVDDVAVVLVDDVVVVGRVVVGFGTVAVVGGALVVVVVSRVVLVEVTGATMMGRAVDGGADVDAEDGGLMGGSGGPVGGAVVEETLADDGAVP